MMKNSDLFSFSNKYLILFSCCIPVKGARRSTICDLQREKFDFIPNILFTILTEFRNRKFQEIIEFCGNENLEFLKEYLKFLIQNEYAFFSDEPEKFPALNLDWKSPHEITNAIIDFDEYSNHNMERIIKELEILRCPAIQLRFYNSPLYKELLNILSYFEGTGVRTLELIFKYSPEYQVRTLKEVLQKFPRVSIIILTSSPTKREITYNNYYPNIIFQTQIVDSPKCCGSVSLTNFRVNILLFTEAQKYNSCLNRKIGIDKDGFIKNCPTSEKSYGQVDTISLSKVVKSRSFKNLWSINKDMISICKDCEFRYICTDCRVVVENKFSKPLKCKYDPYDAKWEK